MSDTPTSPAGTYLTRAERINRKDELRRQREELRNAMRFALTEQGVSKAQMQEVLLEVGNTAIKQFADSRGFENLLRAAVRKEIESAFANQQGGLPSMVREMVRGEAMRYAKEFVDKNILIKLTEGGAF